MQQNQSSSQLEPEDRCPDCVSMKLEGFPIKERWLLWDRPIKALELFLTILFNEQEEKILGGAIRFGIKRGTLSLDLTNCSSPSEGRSLSAALQPNLSIERQEESSSKEKSSSGSSISAQEVSAKTDSEREESERRKDKIKFDMYQVSTKGSASEPKWDFEVKTGERCLKGTIEGKPLATLAVNAVPCTIKATFTAFPRELYIQGIDGLWHGEISRNKRAIIERLLIVSKFLGPKLKPYLSRQELRYD